MKSKVFNIFKKEIREMFRDKKSLMMMLVIPIMIPLLVLGMSALFDSEVNKSQDEYNKIGFNYAFSDVEKKIAKEAGIKVVYKDSHALKKMYDDEQIDLYVERDGDKYIINGEDNDTTAYASALVENYFSIYKEYLQTQYLANNNINPNEVVNIIKIEENIVEKDNFYASYITNYAFLFIIMAITVSATYPATDTTAGEKERGTLETLLTFPISSKDIIVGKFLSVSISSIITGVISLLLTIVSLAMAGEMFEIYDGVNLMLSTNSLLFASIVIISYSFLISGLCIAIASTTKTFKEASSALMPLTFISFFPGMIAFMMDIKTNTLYSLIPFLNCSLIFTDITNGGVNFFHIFLMILSTIVVIWIVLYIIIRQYKSEKVLFSK